MKLLIVLLLSLSTVHADTTAIEQVLFDGNTNYEEATLLTEKTRTEYRTVRVPSTCYRTEYRRRCHRTRPVCRDNVCRPGRTICRTVPVQVRYRCVRTERRAVQVHDYNVETKVMFNFDNSDIASDANENFKVKVTGETVNLSVNSSKNYIVVLDLETRSENRQAGTKFVEVNYKINFIPASKLNEVLGNGIQNVSYKNGIVGFKLGAGFNFDEFMQNIKIFRHKRVGRDILLLDRQLQANDAQVQTTANASVISVNLNNLGINAPSKARVILNTKFKMDLTKVLNKSDLKFEDSVNWIFR